MNAGVGARDAMLDAPGASLTVEDIEALGRRVTLLEDSLRHSGGYPMYLSVTLLEALEEHYCAAGLEPSVGGGQAPPAVARVLGRRVLCLADAIPGCLHGPETFPLDGSVRRPAILDCVLDLALRGPPSDVPEASRFAAWVQQGQVGRSLLPWETLVITTDGSFLPSHVQGGLVRCP